MAQEERYSEPDPRIDLSGKDVIRKLVILAREAGYRIEQEDVEKNLFVPNDFFEGSLDDFWNGCRVSTQTLKLAAKYWKKSINIGVSLPNWKTEKLLSVCRK